MKLWISMLILTLLVASLCVWDTIHTNKVFTQLENISSRIDVQLQNEEIKNEILRDDINSLNSYWTKKMDTLCISISRKDLQPVSDYLQYLYSAINNNNIEDAKTYSRLLIYNITGLKESTGISCVNLL